MTAELGISKQNQSTQVLKLLDFLSDYDAQRNKPVRNIADYGLFNLTEQSLPDHESVRLNRGAQSWLSVDFIDLPKPPIVPAGIAQDIDGGAQPGPKVRPPVTVPAPEVNIEADAGSGINEENSAQLRSEAVALYEARVLAADAWIDDNWAPWAAAHRLASQVKTLHRNLFEQREHIALDRESVELVWGFGRVRWMTDGYTIDHPLITVAVEIDMDSKTQCINVSQSGSPEVEMRYLAGLDVHDRNSLTSVRRSVTTFDLDPWDSSDMPELVQRLARSIHDSGVIVDAAGPPSESLAADRTWTLYLRKRVPDSQGFLDQMRSIYLGGGKVPAPLLDIVSSPDEPPIGMPNQIHSSAFSANPATEHEPLLLPLPTNEEQKRILELAQSHPGVTVQGPPGTGKSHTIANLISHYVAYGQKVLVVSEKEQALRVLAAKVPEGIRDLTVSVLGADNESRKSLENSVMTIQSRVGTLDAKATDQRIQRLKQDLEEANRKIALTTTEMLRARQAEVETVSGSWSAGADLTPQQAAKWVRDNSDQLGFIPDELSLSTTIPVSTDEFAEYLRLLDSLGVKNFRLALEFLPSSSELPVGSDLAILFETADNGYTRANAVQKQFSDWKLFTTAENEQRKQAQLSAANLLACLEELEASPYEPHISRLGDELLKEELSLYSSTLSGLREQAIGLRSSLMTSVVTSPTEATEDSVVQIEEVLQHLRSKGKLGLFDGKLKKVLGQFTVDGREPRTAADADMCVLAAKLDLVRQQLVRVYRNQSAIAHEFTTSSRPEDDVSQEIISVNQILGLPDQRKTVTARLSSVGVSSTSLDTSSQVKAVLFTLDEAHYYFSATAAQEEISNIETTLKVGGSKPGAAALWFQLEGSLNAQDIGHWSALRDESIRLGSFQEPARRLKVLDNRLRAKAPRWITEIEANPETAPLPETISEAWQWAQLNCWVTAKQKLASPAELQKQLDEYGNQRRRVVVELVEAMAWRRLSDNLGPQQRQALQGYLKAVQRYGKTGGKYAQRWIKEMREALDDSKAAVPVWVMTTARALTSFRPSIVPPFDVLIIDEASQIGFEAIPLLSLAKKAIVVGDDKQTSPEHVGLDRQLVFDLLDDHLADVPKYRVLFDPDNSLYDLAIQKFAAPVMLSEHFRSLPEIIEFSNTHAYNGKIIPLRDQPPAVNWRPLGVVRVLDGYREHDINRQEAAQVVRLIGEMSKDNKYDNMTFGVVTLLGTSQAKLIHDLLYDRFGPEFLLERQIRCGEAANFQGDERDVIIISTVVAHDPNHTTRFGAMTSVKDLRKINVAASRARNQMLVVTSVDPEMLPDGDFRAALIRHCGSYLSVRPGQESLLEACDSEFERKVVTDLVNRGYAGIEVQKVVGRYRLDIVVSGPERRLAIECDGDRWHGPEVWHQDRARQEVLERSGWTFERIRGSAYFRNPAEAMEPVWARLEALGITTGDSWHEETSRSNIREVTAADLEPPLSRAPAPETTNPEIYTDGGTCIPNGDNLLAPVQKVVPEVEVSRPIKNVATLDATRSSAEGSNTVEQVQQLEQAPEGQTTPADTTSDSSHVLIEQSSILAPYKQWTKKSLLPVSDENVRAIEDGIVAIVQAEGPMLARQAYVRYQQATGGSRVGKALQKIFNRAASRAIRSSRLLRIHDGIHGVVDATLYVHGQEPVQLRELGPRTLHEVPKSEIQTMLSALSHEGVTEEDLDRELLNVFGLTQLTQRRKAHLEECRNYHWSVE